jgi:CheY-like chemotaxis protein
MRATTLNHVYIKNLDLNQKLNVLLVEDDVLSQIATSSLLSKCGFSVTIAKNGIEAIERIKCKKFQFVLMDMQMPEMDGRDATRNIREMPDHYFRTIPIFSFSTTIQKKENAVELGMTDIAAKPLNALDLKNKIIKYVTNVDNC